MIIEVQYYRLAHVQNPQLIFDSRIFKLNSPVNQLNAANGAKSVVDLEVGDGVFEKASGITTYSRNAIRLAGTGKEKLEAGLEAEIAMYK